jgi:hypothetical protein
MHIKQLKIITLKIIPTCFDSRTPYSGNPKYKGIQVQSQQSGITMIKTLKL